LKLCVVTGEASGDLHAADVIRELRGEMPDIDVFGIGGAHLAHEGVRIEQGIDEMAVFGLFNVIRQIPMFRRIFKRLVATIAQERPDAVLLVDFPDFNLRVARECRKLGIPVIYFISPQLWAWRKGRIHEIKKNVDLMLVIFPFEERFYRERGVEAFYVGHPLVDQLEGVRRTSSVLDTSRPLKIALLPGSRRSEVASLLTPMLDAIAALRLHQPVEATILLAPTIEEAQVRALLGDRFGIRVTKDTKGSLAASDIAIASSGTATLECAIIGVPVVVLYRLSRMTYEIGIRLVKIPNFSLVNIVAGKRLVPELLQDAVTAANIVTEVELLSDKKAYEELTAGLEQVRLELGEPGAARRAAGKIATLLRQGTPARSAGADN